MPASLPNPQRFTSVTYFTNDFDTRTRGVDVVATYAMAAGAGDLNLTAAYEFGDNWTFTTVNGYREFDSAEVFDADGSAAPFLEFAEIAQGHQFSHEGRFSYAGSALRASFGWNFFTEDGLQNVPFATEEGTFLQCLTSLFGAPLIAGIPCVAPDGSVPATGVTALATNGAANAIPYASVFENQGRNEAYSVFADVTWMATDSLELTAGARLLEENRKSAYRSNVPDAVLSGAPLIPGQIDTGGRLFSAEDSFSALLPRFNALYRISNDANVFATVSKGRRSPVVQMGARVDDAGNVVPNRQDIPEETVWNYEAGLKLATGRVSGSLGVYYQVYDNFQVSVEELDANGNPTGSFVTRSAGAASNLGVEAEIAVEATDWLSFFGNVGYIDGGIDDEAGNGRFAGARFRLQPEWQAAGGFTLDVPIGDGARFFATPSVTYRSRIVFELPSATRPDPISQGPVTLVNARAGISIDHERFEIAGFIRNAFDENYLLDAGNTGGSFRIPTYIPAEPRLFGIEVTARFGD